MPNRFRLNPLSAALLLAFGGTTQAATITVTSNADAALPSNDGNCTLREAVAAANTNMPVDACDQGDVGLDAIEFNNGLDTITLNAGQIDIIETLSITGPAAGQTISGNNASRIFAVTVANQPLTLENLTLAGGYTSTNGVSPPTCAADTGEGGAICTLGDLTLTNSTVSGNSTMGQSAKGGGLQIDDSATLINSTISGNSTIGKYAEGGGLVVEDGPTTLINSTVSGNSTAGASAEGGGLYVRNGPITLTNSTVSGNSTAGASAEGGGLYVGNGLITLINTILAANTGLDDNLATRSATLNASHSLFGDDASEINGTDTNNVFTNAPDLAALADNGCLEPAGAPGSAACVQTRALNGGSLALDAADDSVCEAMPVNDLDQRGVTRGFDAIDGLNTPRPGDCDIGLFGLLLARCRRRG